MKRLAALVLFVPFCLVVSEWQPVLPADVFPHSSNNRISSKTPSLSSIIAQQYKQPQLEKSVLNDQCALHKVGFIQDLYFQYIQYRTAIQELREFTLCYWARFYNHTNDHPIFSYAVDSQPRAIYAWVSNSARSSYFSLSVNGHTLYRLNYPLRMNRWYHTCQSWNGRTGEWQIWVNAERVGRGFLNRLVDHKIPAGGIAITGQEQTQPGGGFMEGEGAPRGSGGMLGEITMLQLYRVALTAGKAHKDHKHHHGQLYDHDGNLITTTPLPPASPRPTLPPHPLLIAGQLNPEAAFEIASSLLPRQYHSYLPFYWNYLKPPFFLRQNAANGRGAQSFMNQGIPGAVRGNLKPPLKPQTQSLLQQQLLEQSVKAVPSGPLLPTPGPPLLSEELLHSSLSNPASVQYIDKTQLETHQLFKREHKKGKSLEDEEEILPENDGEFGKKLTSKSKRQTSLPISEVSTSDSEIGDKNVGSDKKKKRQLYLGTLGNNDYLGDTPEFEFTFEQSLQYGLAGVGQNQPILEKQKAEDEREPAEAEVNAVLRICSGCDAEPFERALILSWREVEMKLYSGASYMPAQTECRLF